MDKEEKFSIGDKVVRIGTKVPVMTIKGKTMKGGLPYTTLADTWTCYWADHEPHWEEINESELELFYGLKLVIKYMLMGDPKLENLKKEITNNIVNEFNLQIEEVLSMCESEIEKLMLLHFYRYFQTAFDDDEEEPLYKLGFVYDWIDDISYYENPKLRSKVEKYAYREDSLGYHKTVGLKVILWSNESLEFEVLPQYPVIVDNIEYRLDIAVIMNKKERYVSSKAGVDLEAVRNGGFKVIESRKIALECDGYDYHSSPEQKRNDDIRTRKLKKSGWKEVLRYSGKELHSIKSIEEAHSLFQEIIEILFI